MTCKHEKKIINDCQHEAIISLCIQPPRPCTRKV